MRRILMSLGIVLASPTAHAGGPTESTAVEVSIEEHRGKELVEKARYVLPVSGDGVWSKLSEARGGVRYEVELGRQGGDAAEPVVELNLSRHSLIDKQSLDQSMRASARLKHGARLLMGHFERDGGSTNVFLSIREGAGGS